jgi:hypothetical protein
VPTDDRNAIYCTRSATIIDLCHGTALQQQARLRALTADYGHDLVILPFAEACRRRDAAARSQPVEITAARWAEALELLPPVGWQNDGARESFKQPERITGMITSIYVRLGDRQFSFADDIRTPHALCCEIVARSRAYLAPESRWEPESGFER